MNNSIGPCPNCAEPESICEVHEVIELQAMQGVRLGATFDPTAGEAVQTNSDETVGYECMVCGAGVQPILDKDGRLMGWEVEA